MSHAYELGIATTLLAIHRGMEKAAATPGAPAATSMKSEWLIPDQPAPQLTPQEAAAYKPWMVEPMKIAPTVPTTPAPMGPRRAVPAKVPQLPTRPLSMSPVAPGGGLNMANTYANKKPLGWQDKVLGWWGKMDPRMKQNIMRALVVGGAGAGLIGMLASRLRPAGQRPGILGTLGAGVGYGLAGAGIGAGLGALATKFGPKFWQKQSPTPGADAAAAPATAPAATPPVVPPQGAGTTTPQRTNTVPPVAGAVAPPVM